MDTPLPAAAVELPGTRRPSLAAAAMRTLAGNWAIQLMMLMLGISGAGWFVLATALARAPHGAAAWVPQAMPGVGIVQFAAAAGVWERRRWAWVAALVYVAAGAAALLLPIGGALPFGSQYLLALGSLGVAAIPALVLHRREFLTPACPPGAS
jgi:hypothetical protein